MGSRTHVPFFIRLGSQTFFFLSSQPTSLFFFSFFSKPATGSRPLTWTTGLLFCLTFSSADLMFLFSLGQPAAAAERGKVAQEQVVARQPDRPGGRGVGQRGSRPGRVRHQSTGQDGRRGASIEEAH